MSDAPSVQVAVCVVADAPALDDCLHALAEQSAPTLVVTAGLAERATAALEARVAAALPAAGVLHESLPGRAQARNRALAACNGDVLAYLDPDVVVGDGWWDTLRLAWAVAPSELGCIGGPIRVRFRGKRPAWLGDSLLLALGPLDYGEKALDLDPLERTLMGGNLSFRASALRGVGGFWPARGDDAQLDWFSEEHHAQRELARVGWRTTYEPQLEAWRVVAAPRPRSILHRRLHYGARLALVGQRRPPSAAVRELARGTVGAALAMVRGRSASAVERAARVAENAGVLIARLVAHADFQPGASATPFRHSIPPSELRAAARVVRGAATRSRKGAVILLYHRVSALESDPLGLCVTPEHFAQQVDVVRERFAPLSLTELCECVRRGNTPPRRGVVVTFDDGYEDNRAAFSVLTGAGVPATLFASTGHVEQSRWFWWDELEVLARSIEDAARPPLELQIGGEGRGWVAATREQREAARWHLHAWLASQDPDDASCALATLRAWAGAAPVDAPPADYRPMTVAELQDVAGLPGIEVGAHTRRHASLASVAEDVARDEIATSRADVERWLGSAPPSFSYPFGVPGVDFTPATASLVAAAGFDLAVSNCPGVVTASSDRFALPRHVAADCDGERFEQWLAARF